MELIQPDDACGTGVLVLAGSSGRVDGERAKLLARHGALAAPLQWFGGPEMQPGPWEVPLEVFIDALDILAPEVDRLAILGVSFGTEAALIMGSRDDRVSCVAAFAPTSVLWAGFDEVNRRPTSKWTCQGRPLPFLSIMRPSSRRSGEVPSHLATYKHSFAAADPVERERATIAVERIEDVLLVSGGDDQVWPSCAFAEDIITRRARHGMPTRYATLDTAGHRTLLPGEEEPTGGLPMRRGGTPDSDAALGSLAWPQLCVLLRLRP